MYNILLLLIYRIILIVNPNKYQHWIQQQQEFSKNIHLNKNAEKVIWIHCASLGEYEQIKPLLSNLKKIKKNIHLTFFSPTAHTHFQDQKLISNISCLPLDTKLNMESFIENIQPMMAIISKNDIWPNMITSLRLKKIPVYMIGTKFKKTKMHNWFIQQYYRKYLPMCTHIFCQDQETYQFLINEKIGNASMIGDLRINQVLLDRKRQFHNKQLNNFCAKNKVIIYGSIEPGDYNIIIDTINTNKELKHIVVPHDNSIKTIKKITNQIQESYILYSEINNKKDIQENILIVNQFGILKYLYRFSDIAYIGGGFNKGVHNTLEPAVCGNLIFFGPKYKNFPETELFIKNNLANSVKNKLDFQKKLSSLTQNPRSKSMILKQFSSLLRQRKQNIKIIMEKINQQYLL